MNNEVCFNQESLIKIDDMVIDNLKNLARKNNSGKYRLCLHHNPQDNLHEMFIVCSKGGYIRPGKHLNTTESHTIIDGAMLVIIFEENGQIREVFEVSKEKYHTYRIDTDTYHMQIPLTEQVVYYEVRLGPFTDKGNVFPNWAPDPRDTENVRVYMEGMKKRIHDFVGAKGSVL